MDMDLYKKIVEDCGNYTEHIKSFQPFMDGEPLLDNFLEERIRIAKKAGIRFIQIATNGTLLTRSRARSLVESGLDSIIIALEDIDKDVHEQIRRGSSYNKIISNLENFISIRSEAGLTRPEIIIRMLGLEENSLHREAFLQHWKTKADQVVIVPVHNWGGAISLGRKISHPNLECSYLWRQMVILVDGTVALCCLDYDGVHVLGNVYNESLYDIWHGEKFAEYREKFKNCQVDLCSRCNWIPGSLIAYDVRDRASHMPAALDQHYVTKNIFDGIYQQADKMSKMISGLITYLRNNEARFKQKKQEKPKKP